MNKLLLGLISLFFISCATNTSTKEETQTLLLEFDDEKKFLNSTDRDLLFNESRKIIGENPLFSLKPSYGEIEETDENIIRYSIYTDDVTSRTELAVESGTIYLTFDNISTNPQAIKKYCLDGLRVITSNFNLKMLSKEEQEIDKKKQKEHKLKALKNDLKSINPKDGINSTEAIKIARIYAQKYTQRYSSIHKFKMNQDNYIFDPNPYSNSPTTNSIIVNKKSGAVSLVTESPSYNSFTSFQQDIINE